MSPSSPYDLDAHNTAVSGISASVSRFARSKTPFKVYHGSTNSTRITSFARDRIVDTSALNHVLSITRTSTTSTSAGTSSPTAKPKYPYTAFLEPNVPFDALVRATLAHDPPLVPPVVPEFPGITAGGAFAGVAGESSSFVHGFFDQTVERVEVVLPDEEGRVLRDVRPDGEGGEEGRKLFWGVAGSFGSVAVVTGLEVGLVRAGRREMGRGLKYEGRGDVGQKEREVQFLDGMLFARDRGAIVSARMVDAESPDAKGLKTVRFDRARDEWFYIYIDKLSKRAASSSRPSLPAANGSEQQQPIATFLTPLPSYLFRFDRGAFWTASYAFPLFHTPFTRLTRCLLDPLMRTRRLYRAWNASGFAQSYFVQDVAVPFESVAELVDWVESELPGGSIGGKWWREEKGRGVGHGQSKKGGVWPIWLCPLRVEGTGGVPLGARVGAKGRREVNETFAAADRSAGGKPQNVWGEDRSAAEKPSHLLNLGIWGPGPPSHDTFIETNRSLEQLLHTRLGGFKWLYANAYYTEEEFWDVYNKEAYEEVRKKTEAHGWVPSVFEKTRAKEERVERGRLRGVLAAVGGEGKGYLLKAKMAGKQK
ncbi:hypothetical protein BDY21DRAFT_397381 [Lineolata rhizophorae]|uniref:FAD-binding PCMH-type domain-containing protein n=1 Tax=Lineolata rhizophorae TaxID=578093 RepID=A0A6A6NUQ7_9PEZI|nr:hypothetical protein BDY21DRAFT_397381 [Lineolata rhizophorae]